MSTPLVRLRQGSDEKAPIWAKCEYRNPTGSHKDRVFGFMLEELERKGEIYPGMTLIECSTGNGGAALSKVARDKGYQVIIIMPAGMTKERHEQIASFGGALHEISPEGFLLEAEDEGRRLAESIPNAYFLDQSTNELNWKSWQVSGQEILEQVKAAGVQPTHFICSLGTGGTFTGIAAALRTEYPSIKTIAVEVDKSAALYAKRHGIEFHHQPHNLMGLGAGKVPSNLNEDLVDEVETISGEQSWAEMKSVIENEDLQIGPTAGGNIYAARRLARRIRKDDVIVTVLFDSAWKYRSIWDGHYDLYA